ncbi:hypothetical protein EDB92DRAFT_2107324 [Lactarius akahatsu]|uniref:Protein LCHN n=1 Tax=Lactarius akahatsu TaxID=416441 RepID=A0AAD4L4N8_9AGAM|nr:hypothetical protein EDB92DRAFT_2107324 [Lactarius akahatsu]
MATAAGSTKAPPQDIVAIFHASFHPTRGNDLDWSLKATDDLQLDGVEFSSLPSGLHLVEQDVVYFTKDGLRGVCVFTRRQTSEQGQRGFRLSSLGILLARSLRPRPWRHVPALKALVRDLHSDSAPPANSSQDVWEPARRFFELRKARLEDLGGAGGWHRWSEELEFDIDDGGVEDVGDGYEQYTHASPTLHLPHLLRVLGPSSLTLYKHVLGRRRILIYTQPPVEAACFLCQVAADMCFEDQTTPATQGPNAAPQLKGKHKEGINVLGSVTLHDVDMLERESRTGRGWIACTTDTVFLEKPQYYDLLIDLTSYAPTERRATARPGLQLAIKELSARRPTYRLSTIRFTWSDVKLWTELDRILQLDADTNGVARARAHRASAPVWAWADAWGVYEDVCVVCARLCSGLWRSDNSNGSSGSREQWGSPRERSGRRRAHVRAYGDGIEGRRSSYRPQDDDDVGKYGSGSSGDEDEDGAVLVRSRQTRTTLALLQTFHAQTRFLLSRLATVLPSTASPLPDAQLTPRDLLVLALGPLSSLDARFVEWLAEEYAGGARVSVRRGWRDLLGGLVGAAVGGSGTASSS